MNRFFTAREQIEGTVIHITGSDANHIKNVLRMKRGEEIRVSCGDRMEYVCSIEALHGNEILAGIMYAQESRLELPSHICLYQGLPKRDKMERIIQKAVELGVCKIVPVSTKRCVVKLDAKKADGKRKRWQAVSESAAKQSGRMIIPQVAGVMGFGEAVSHAKRLDVRLIPYELARDMERTRKLLSGIRPGQSAGIFIGPEGGFAEEEARYAMEQGIQPITLGRRILRTETAGMAVLSVLAYLLEQ